MDPVLAEVYPLPRAGIEPAVSHRDGHGASQDGGLNVGWHIVGTLYIVQLTARILGHGFVEMGFEILPDIRVRVFVLGEGSGGMAYENMRDTQGEFGQLRQLLDHLACN